MDAEEGASAAHAVTVGDNTNGIIPLYLLKNDTPQLHTRTIQYTKVPTIPHSLKQWTSCYSVQQVLQEVTITKLNEAGRHLCTSLKDYSP